MAEIDLPFVEAGTSPGGVLSALRKHRRGAAVTQVDGQLRLVTIAEVRRAQAAETPTIGEVARTPLDAGLVSVGALEGRGDESDEAEDDEEASGALAFSVFPLRRGVGPRRDRGGDRGAIARVNGPQFGQYGASFVCNGKSPENAADAPHMFPDPGVALNDDCPNCVTPRGTRAPTIRALF
jgi:hypothetical protein